MSAIHCREPWLASWQNTVRSKDLNFNKRWLAYKDGALCFYWVTRCDKCSFTSHFQVPFTTHTCYVRACVQKQGMHKQCHVSSTPQISHSGFASAPVTPHAWFCCYRKHPQCCRDTQTIRYQLLAPMDSSMTCLRLCVKTFKGNSRTAIQYALQLWRGALRTEFAHSVE